MNKSIKLLYYYVEEKLVTLITQLKNRGRVEDRKSALILKLTLIFKNFNKTAATLSNILCNYVFNYQNN